MIRIELLRNQKAVIKVYLYIMYFLGVTDSL